MKVQFTLIYGTGWCELSFRKDIELPCPPFDGLRIYREVGDHSIEEALVSNDYQKTRYFYDLEDEVMRVDIVHLWRWNTISRDTIDHTVNSLTAFGWKLRQSESQVAEFIKNYSGD